MELHCNIQEHDITAYTYKNNAQAKDDAHFLGEGGKDKIGLRYRDRIRLSLKQPGPEPAAGTDRKQGLCHLVSASGLTWIWLNR